MSETIQHNCALVGIALKKETSGIYHSARGSLMSLQHRGQEAVGIGFESSHELFVYKAPGLVSGGLNEKDIKNFPPTSVLIGHTRYPTSNGYSLESAQPFKFGDFAIAHNGNIPVGLENRDGEPESDTYAVGRMINEEQGGFEERTAKVLGNLNGAYSFLFLNEGSLYAARDPWGMKPLVFGEIEIEGTKGVLLASETAPFGKLGSHPSGELPRGGLYKVNPEKGIEIVWMDPRAVEPAHCTFETSYFADATSQLTTESLHEVSNHTVRVELGKALAIKIRTKGMLDHAYSTYSVVAVPNSGFSYAQGVGEELAIPLTMGIHPSRYSGRTFINSGTSLERKQAALEKYNFVDEEIKNRRIILVDDSIVRGPTMSGIVLNLLDRGALQVIVAVGMPPVFAPCHWGVAFPTKQELIYHQLMNGLDHSENLTSEKIEEFENKLAVWLTNGNEEYRGRVRVVYQDINYYKKIVNGDFENTFNGETTRHGCFHCVSGNLPQGLLYP